MDDFIDDAFETYVEDHVEENAYLLLEDGDVYRTWEVPTFLFFAYSPATIWIKRTWEHGNKSFTVVAHGPFDIKVVLQVEEYKKKPAPTSKIDELMKWARENGKVTQPSTLKK